MQEVPGGESIMTEVEDRQMDKDLVKKLSDKARRASGKTEEIVKQRAERMASFVKQQEEKAKTAAHTAAQAAKAKSADIATQAKSALSTAQDKIEKAAEVVKEKVVAAEKKVESAAVDGKEALKNASDKTKEAVKETADESKATLDRAADAIKPSTPLVGETVPVDYQRPRQLDATPQPPRVAPLETYTGPPLPIGFEPPPGYTVKKATSPTAVPGGPKPAPPPLPLVAPTVSQLSSSEPVLGQLASTIDNLAKYLNDSPTVVGDKGAREVLNTATLDLKSLGNRLNEVKEEERKKLETQIEAKTREYSSSLLQAERELVERLEKQEDDWKAAFESERKTLVDAYRQKLDGELAVQKELIEQRLQEEVVAQGVEMQRKWLRDVKERVETERAGRLGKIETLQTDIEQLSKTTLENSSWLDDNREVNKLWTALRAAWDASLDGRDATPFFREFAAVRNVAAKSPTNASTPGSDASESTIEVALASIPANIQESGVETFPTLAAWFTDRLVPKIRKASLLPINGGFITYLTSAAASSLLFQKIGFVQGGDVISTLSRAEWHLSHKDLDSAAREVNQLVGWPKILARDWLEAARRHLEVRQALQIVEAEAGLASLLIL